jgi:carbonic anhydrase/acetyltransferase-like protein (isoleucine patch superfamily)
MGPVYALKGLTPQLGAGVFVAPTASVIGDVVLGDESSIWFGAVLRGDVFPIRVGACT